MEEGNQCLTRSLPAVYRNPFNVRHVLKQATFLRRAFARMGLGFVKNGISSSPAQIIQVCNASR